MDNLYASFEKRLICWKFSTINSKLQMIWHWTIEQFKQLHKKKERFLHDYELKKLEKNISISRHFENLFNSIQRYK